MSNKKVYAFVTNGTEEVELLAVVDILRRAGVSVDIVGVGCKTAICSRGTTLTADSVIEEQDFTDADCLFVPGGMPGSKTMGENKLLIDALKRQSESGKIVAAICAAPALVLGKNGFLVGKNGVCSPGFEKEMTGCSVRYEKVCVCENIVTARGLGCALELGLTLVELLCNTAVANDIKQKICM